MIQFYLQLIETETDQEKFEKLYYKYRRLMRKIAYDLLQDMHLAEDAVQDAFLRIIKNFHKIGEIDCPETKAFVVIIVRNVALNSIKKDQCRPPIQEIHNVCCEENEQETDGMHWEKLSSGIDETADEILRKEIQKTFTEALKKRYDTIDNPEGISYENEFSPRFEYRMKRMIKNFEHIRRSTQKKDAESEKVFYYNQSVVTETMNLSLDNEAESFAAIEINGHRGYSVDEPEYSAITWSDGVSLYTISGNTSLQELIPIAESLD